MTSAPSVLDGHTPKQNHLLAALPAAEYERLLPGMELVQLPLGWALDESGGRLQHLYFLVSGIVSLFYVTENGASAEIAITGCEGCVGISLFMGGTSTSSRAVVRSAGYAYRLRADVVMREFERSSSFQDLLLRYTQALITMAAQTAACNRHHRVEQQLCRWLLLRLDRQSSNELSMTQALIANMLGVRREGVSEAAKHLRQAGLIKYGRGHITVLSRPKVEARACECYAVVKKETDRLHRIDMPRL